MAKHKTAIPAVIGAYLGVILGLVSELIEKSHWEEWPAALLLLVAYGFMGVIFYVMWRSIRKSESPLYDWAENYRELLEERREFRKEEHEQDLYRRKF